MTLAQTLEQAVWVAHSLYDRCKTSGSSANISFLHDGTVYISVSGACFGTLTACDFAQVCLDGTPLDSKKGSKEFALHRALYEKGAGVTAVLHTHGTYATAWSCLPHEATEDVIPPYTPYLRMKLGKVVLVPYAPPGSAALFEAFRERLCSANGYLLRNHGAIVGACSMMEAYFALEELEESARIAWMLRGEPDQHSLYCTHQDSTAT